MGAFFDGKGKLCDFFSRFFYMELWAITFFSVFFFVLFFLSDFFFLKPLSSITQGISFVLGNIACAVSLRAYKINNQKENRSRQVVFLFISGGIILFEIIVGIYVVLWMCCF